MRNGNLVVICQSCGGEALARQPWSPRQKEVLEFIVGFEQRHGHPPTYGQIANHLKVTSRATVAKHVRALERRGFLEPRQGRRAEDYEQTTTS